MKKLTICVLAFSLSISIWSFPGFAQASSGTGGTAARGSSGGTKPSLNFDTSEFPLWAKDLRRAEIVAFGSFPFSIFFTTFAMDTWRCYSHDWDPLYAPWPAKPPGAINMTQDELTMTIALAAAVSVVVAITDFSIVQIKRYRERQQIKKMPTGSPITITQKTIVEPEPEAPEPGSQSEAKPEPEADLESGTNPEPEAEPGSRTEPEPAVKVTQPVMVPPPNP